MTDSTANVTYPALWYTSGTPLRLGQRECALLVRLERYISPEPNTGCWLWTGGAWENLYGRINVDGAMRYAHRVVYTLLKGPIPPELTLDHLCRTTFCVNPAHLEPVSFSENMRRRDDVRAKAARQACDYGHTRWGMHYNGKRNTRFCLECHRLRELERRRGN